MSEATIQHAFVSYVREDADAVDQLVSVLQAASIPVWKDTENLPPGEDWQQKIREAIEDGSLAFIACFSTGSVQKAKTYMNAELNLAVEQIRLMRPGRVWLLPVRLDDCELPHFDLGGSRTLDSLQRIDLFGPKREANLARLVAAVRAIFGDQATAVGNSRTERSETAVRDNTGSISMGPYAKALEQLSSGKREVRIAGIYTLGRIALDSISYRPDVMEVLSGFVSRHSWEQQPTGGDSKPSGEADGVDRAQILGADIQVAVRVLSQLNKANYDTMPIEKYSAIQNVNLNGANLNSLDLSGAFLTYVDFTSANLVNANLTKATLGRANLKDANLRSANLSEANLIEANLRGANLISADLSYTSISGVNLAKADLTCAVLNMASPSRMHFAKDKLTVANSPANLAAAKLTGAKLIHADLPGANLVSADFTDADLFHAKLADADLHLAKLINANLAQANLTNAFLNDADLTGADLTGADLTGANWHRSWAPDGWSSKGGRLYPEITD